jgi:hypothetical protein
MVFEFYAVQRFPEGVLSYFILSKRKAESRKRKNTCPLSALRFPLSALRFIHLFIPLIELSAIKSLPSYSDWLAKCASFASPWAGCGDCDDKVIEVIVDTRDCPDRMKVAVVNH